MNGLSIRTTIASAACLFSFAPYGALAANPAPPAGYRAMPAAAIAPRASRRLYVANYAANSIDIYPAGVLQPKKIGSIARGVFGPADVFIDAAGTLYVANVKAYTIAEYPSGQMSPSVVLRSPVAPYNLAVGPTGTVSTCGTRSTHGPDWVVEFDRGATQPSRVIKYSNQLPDNVSCGGLAADAADNLYVNVGSGSSGGGYAVEVYAPKQIVPYRDIFTSNGYAYGGIEIAHGHMIVGDPFDNGIVVEPLPKAQTQRVIATSHGGDYLALDAASGYLYATSMFNQTLQIYDFASGQLLSTFASSGYGVAIDPPAY